MTDEIGTYRVYYESDDSDPDDPLFTEVMARTEDEALRVVRMHPEVQGRYYTHAEFTEEDLLQDE